MLHRFGRRTTHADLDGLWIVHGPGDQRLDFGGHGGAEERGDAIFRTFFKNAFHIRQEPHVEHAIGLIQHHVGDALEFGGALLHVIKQPAWSSHNNIHAVLQSLNLFAVAHAPVDDRHLMIGKPRVITDSCLHLRSQFPGRFQNQHAGGTIRFR